MKTDSFIVLKFHTFWNTMKNSNLYDGDLEKYYFACTSFCELSKEKNVSASSTIEAKENSVKYV